MKPLLLLLSLGVVLNTNAQQSRFVIVQSAPNEPFYLHMGEVTYSSNAFGTLVLAPLKDSTWQVAIGFPRNKNSEREFRVTVSGSDKAFDIRKSSDGSFRLYEWQKAQYLDPLNQPVQDIQPSGVARTDAYSKLMAGVVDDPAVAIVTSAAPEPPVAAIIAQTSQRDSVRSAPPESGAAEVVVQNTQKLTSDTIRPIVREEKPVSAPAAIAPVNPGLSDSSGKSDTSSRQVEISSDARGPEPGNQLPVQAAPLSNRILLTENKQVAGGRQMTFMDAVSGITDTVQVFIPAEQTSETVTSSPDSSSKPAIMDTARSTSGPLLINSDCSKFASEADVDKLRVLLMKAADQDARMAEARKAFKSRCFTVKHIRGLSELFQKDAERYQFFDAAYPFVSDSGNFRTLISLLSDTYYVKRFKAMVRMED